MTASPSPDDRQRVLQATVPQIALLVVCIMFGFLAGVFAGRSARAGGAALSVGTTPLLICLGLGVVAFAALYRMVRNRRWDISDEGMTLYVAGEQREMLRWDQIVDLRRFITTVIVRTNAGTVHRLFCVGVRDTRWLRAKWMARASSVAPA